jgi:8-oxo-dGTP pyrophosphatase MutT (NUDIX family)
MLNIYEGGDARRGGVDLTISLTKDQADALGEDAGQLVEALDTVLVGLAALRTGRDPIRTSNPSDKDTPVSSGTDWQEWLLRDLSMLEARLQGVQAATVRAHAEAGGSYGALATAMAVAKGTAQTRREAVESCGGPDVASGSWSAEGPGPSTLERFTRKHMSAAELWATGKNGPVDHPGLPVAENMRSWSTDWPGYKRLRPDITAPELQPDGLEASVREGWARPYATVDDVKDWSQRRADALVPFELDEYDEPRHPLGRTGRTGNNLGDFGEVAMVDGIVVTGEDLDRRVLLIRRGDVGRWGTPGGRIEKGESPWEALVREVHEETGLDLSNETPVMFDPRVVGDWRDTDISWAVSAPGLVVIDEPRPVKGGDDAIDARWFPFVSMNHLELMVENEDGLYGPHYGLLFEALKHLEG